MSAPTRPASPAEQSTPIHSAYLDALRSPRVPSFDPEDLPHTVVLYGPRRDTLFTLPTLQRAEWIACDHGEVRDETDYHRMPEGAVRIILEPEGDADGERYLTPCGEIRRATAEEAAAMREAGVE